MAIVVGVKWYAICGVVSFFKNLFVYLKIKVIYIYRERLSICWFTPQKTTMAKVKPRQEPGATSRSSTQVAGAQEPELFCCFSQADSIELDQSGKAGTQMHATRTASTVSLGDSFTCYTPTFVVLICISLVANDAEHF